MTTVQRLHQVQPHRTNCSCCCPSYLLVDDKELLPKELLVKVLEKVPQHLRLRSCSFVCHAWHNAAVAATSRVQMGHFTSKTSTGPRFDNLVGWLTDLGQHVTALSLAKAGSPEASLRLDQLPCRQLQHLTLSKSHLSLTAAPDLTSLTRLDLGSVIGSGGSASLGLLNSNTYEYYPECFSALTQLTSLQHLHVTAAARSLLDKVIDGGRVEFPAGVLSQLVHLTHLDLNLFAVTAPALDNLTRLSDLQYLSFGDIDSDDEYDMEEPIVTADACAALSGLQRLTTLTVPGAGSVLGSSSTPGFTSLTALRKLQLRHGAGLHPSVLSHFTGLQELKLWGAQPHLDIYPPQRGSGSTQALLAVLPALQQLAQLCLYTALPDTAPAAQYSALVASSKLQKLLLTGSELPQAAWRAMFEGRRQLPSLKELTMNGWIRNSGGSSRLRTQELLSVALSCPTLELLCIHGSVDSAADYSVLQPLQHLTQLVTDNISNESAAGLGCLTSLKQLSVMAPNSLTDEGLVHLTTLARMNTLDVVREDTDQDIRFMCTVSIKCWLQRHDHGIRHVHGKCMFCLARLF